MQIGKRNTPGCGARGIGAPPLISTNFVTLRALCLPNAAANAHLKERKQVIASRC